MQPLIQPLKIEIQGDYWDSHIYKGRLYLLTMEGTIKVINWDELVGSYIEKYHIPSEFSYAFSDSTSLYKNENPISRITFRNQFDAYPRNIQISERVLNKHLLKENISPFNELPTDSEIYLDKLYTLQDEGLYSLDLMPNDDLTIKSNSMKRLWDCSLLSLRIRSGGRIALSAGSSGLYEFNIFNKAINYGEFNVVDNNRESKIIQLSKSHSLFPSWNHSSIFSSSDVKDSVLIAFKWINKQIGFYGLLEQKDIFANRSKGYLCWGSGDKLYSAADGGLTIVKYIQENIGGKSAFKELKFMPFQQWKGEIINAGVTSFGTIVECENALVILQSNNEVTNIKGPITKWRVFPRAVRYDNHLHVVKDDKLEIYSFNHDYYTKQANKHHGYLRQHNNYED